MTVLAPLALVGPSRRILLALVPVLIKVAPALAQLLQEGVKIRFLCGVTWSTGTRMIFPKQDTGKPGVTNLGSTSFQGFLWPSGAPSAWPSVSAARRGWVCLLAMSARSSPLAMVWHPSPTPQKTTTDGETTVVSHPDAVLDGREVSRRR